MADNLVKASRYNNLQARISNIMGTGSGSDGYGQLLQSSQVLPGLIVYATDVANLYIDLVKARTHQAGAVPTEIQTVTSDDLIEDDASSPFEPKSWAAYEDLMLDVEADRFLLAPTQASLEAGITSQRTLTWNGSVVHEFTVNFDGYTLSNGQVVTPADHRRHFFNAGGEIRITANIGGGSGSKTNDWKTILSNIGVVKFNYNSTSRTGTGDVAPSGQTVGNYQLTTDYEPIFRKVGSDISLAYSNNSFTIEAKQSGSSAISFRVILNDADTGDPNIDENVNGTLTSTVQTYRANGSNVNVPAPSYNTVVPLG